MAVGSMSDSGARGPVFYNRSGHILMFLLPLIQEGQLSVTGESMHEVLVNRSGGQSLPSKSVVKLTNPSDMTIDIYHGRKTRTQQQQPMRQSLFYF